MCGFVVGAGASSPFPNTEDLAPHDRGPNFGNGMAMAGSTLAVSDVDASCNAQGLCTSRVHLYQRVSGIWTEVAELNLDGFTADFRDTKNPVAVSPSEQTVYFAVKGVVAVFQKPSGGWHDMQPSFMLPIGEFSGSLSGDDDDLVSSTCSQHFDTSPCDYAEVLAKPAGGWGDLGNFPLDLAKLQPTGDHLGSVVAYSSGSVVVAGPSSSDVLTFTQPVAGWHNTTSGVALPVPAHLDFSFLDGGALPFGLSVAFTGSDLAVTTSGKDTSTSAMLDPAIYVFQQSGADWSSPVQLARLTTSSNDLSPDHGFLSTGSANLLLLATPAVQGGSLPTSADDLFVFLKPGGGWVDATESAKIPVAVSASRPGFTSVAATDTALAASYYSSSGGCAASCAKVTVFDSAALTASSDLTGAMDLAVDVPPYAVLYVLPGRHMEVSVQVTNQDVGNASSTLTVTGDVPAEILHPAVTSPQGPCTLTSGSYSCDLGTLAAGAKASVTIAGTAPKQVTKLSQSAAFTAANDRIPRDNSLKLAYLVDTPPVADGASFSGTDKTSGQLQGSDADGDHLTFRIVRPPSFGVAALSASGAFSYSLQKFISTPGNDSFTYVVNDGHMDSQPATVHLNVVRDMPPLGGGDFGLGTDLVLLAALYAARRRRAGTPTGSSVVE